MHILWQICFVNSKIVAITYKHWITNFEYRRAAKSLDRWGSSVGTAGEQAI